MCAVIGAVVRHIDNDCKSKLWKVFQESKIRGIQSFGFVSLNNITRKVLRTLKDSQIESAIDQITDKSLVIMHCRYSTSGNIGQPVSRFGYDLVFNGNINMGTKEELERAYNLQLITDNDGEVFLHKMLFHNELKLLSAPTTSFFGLVLNLHNKSMWAYRNEKRPGYLYYNNKYTVVASTKDILYRAGLTWGNVPSCSNYPIPVPINKAVLMGTL